MASTLPTFDDLPRVGDANDWRATAASILAELAQLPANWDGYSSPPLQPVVLRVAKDLLREIRPGHAPAPHIAPVTGGGLAFSWHLPPRAHELEILPDGLLEYWTTKGDSGGGQEEFGEGSFHPDQLVAASTHIQGLLCWLTSMSLCPFSAVALP
jgi:hypothetical protein